MWQAFWHKKLYRVCMCTCMIKKNKIKKIDMRYNIEKGPLSPYTWYSFSISLYLSLSSSLRRISREDIEVLIYVFIIIETVQVEFY